MTNTRSIGDPTGSGGEFSEPGAVRAALVELDAVLGRLVGGLEPRDVQLPEATEVWKLFDHLRRLAASGAMLMTSRVREANQWKHEGFGSLAEWMAHQSGTSVGKARSEVETADRLGSLPNTADQVRHGELSPEQAEKVSDAAKANPDAEADLLARAKKDSLRELTEEAARRKAEAESEERRARRIRKERSVRHWVGKDGAFHFHAKGPKADGAVLAALLDQLVGRQIRADAAKPKNEREGREALAFDALIGLARPARTSHTTEPDSSEDTDSPGPASPSGSGGGPSGNGGGPTSPTPSPSPSHLALIRVDLAALVRGSVGAGEVCEIPGLGPIALSEARALLGDSVLKLVLTNGVDVANVTHLGRGPNAAQKIALLWRGRTCTVEGCGRPAREVDHRIDFSVTQHTRLDESDPMCSHDHDLKTYKGWALVAGTGVRPLVPPGHPDHPGTAEEQYERQQLFALIE